MGGGNPFEWGLIVIAGPLSPRGRGKPRYILLRLYHAGSIPAWAGETRPPPLLGGGRPVYPRVGGGNRRADDNDDMITGLSPRGRGKPEEARWTSSPSPVYPRVGGGNPSPVARQRASRGLSPRGRGKLGNAERHRVAPGSIPAWAGETGSAGRTDRNPKVYPRVGGGNSCWRCP